MQVNDSFVHGVVLGLDIGDVRIGVARAHSLAALPEPLEIIDRSKVDPVTRIKLLASEENATRLVIGLPVFKSGQEGEQASAIRALAAKIQAALDLLRDQGHGPNCGDCIGRCADHEGECRSRNQERAVPILDQDRLKPGRLLESADGVVRDEPVALHELLKHLDRTGQNRAALIGFDARRPAQRDQPRAGPSGFRRVRGIRGLRHAGHLTAARGATSPPCPQRPTIAGLTSAMSLCIEYCSRAAL